MLTRTVAVTLVLLATGCVWAVVITRLRARPAAAAAARSFDARPIEAHWSFDLSLADALSQCEGSQCVHDEARSLLLRPLHRRRPLPLVARAPTFDTGKAVRRSTTTALPTHSIYIERTPVHGEEPHGPNCLATHEPSLRERPWRVWTLEVVVLFLPSRHFARAWQTIVGRNGARAFATALVVNARVGVAQERGFRPTRSRASSPRST